MSLRNGQLVLRLPQVEKNSTLTDRFKQEAERTFPIEDLGVVILDDKRITITQGLLESLAENNCALITCDSTHHPAGLLLPMEGNTLLSERSRLQVDCSKPLRKQLWQQTVQAKIANQASNLAHLVQAENRNMLVWVGQVRSDDADNLEARAAAYYWKHIFPEIPRFVRGRDGEPPNNLLNYGYAILRAVVARSLVAAGLLPSLGIHHHNRYKMFIVLQRYKFESNSQLILSAPPAVRRCLSFCKDTNLRAIHNCTTNHYFSVNDVYRSAKIQI